MGYEKFLVVASKLDKAGINITTQLSQFKESADKFRFYLVDKEILHTENLDLEKISQYDFIIFASRHKSESKEKTLSVHAPGNWRLAEFGGEKNKACKTSALFMKHIFEKLHQNAEQFHLNDYKITMEATHHGPLIEKPCLFIEIGSSETEWTNTKAAFIVARAISEAITDFNENPHREIAIAIGGPHYCPNFNKLQAKSNIAISHVIPQYAFPLSEEMVKEAVEKTAEELDFVLLDWKGLGNAEQRQRVISILDKMYLNYKKTSDAGK